jgi:hypothetical protein
VHGCPEVYSKGSFSAHFENPTQRGHKCLVNTKSVVQKPLDVQTMVGNVANKVQC